MMVNYSDYFEALGYKTSYYNSQRGFLASELIIERIKSIQAAWKDKYPFVDIKTQNLKFDTLVNFNFSFTSEMELLNTESK
jgi:hypothetical protein